MSHCENVFLSDRRFITDSCDHEISIASLFFSMVSLPPPRLLLGTDNNISMFVFF